jgi:hypothetical protein
VHFSHSPPIRHPPTVGGERRQRFRRRYYYQHTTTPNNNNNNNTRIRKKYFSFGAGSILPFFFPQEIYFGPIHHHLISVGIFLNVSIFSPYGGLLQLLIVFPQKEIYRNTYNQG